MNVLIQGSPSFSEYHIYLRAMGVALSDNDKELNVYSIGLHKLNTIAVEFTNKTRDSLRQRGVKLQFRTIPKSDLKTQKFDKMFYFCKPGEKLSPEAQRLSDSGLDVLVFRY